MRTIFTLGYMDFGTLNLIFVNQIYTQTLSSGQCVWVFSFTFFKKHHELSPTLAVPHEKSLHPPPTPLPSLAHFRRFHISPHCEILQEILGLLLGPVATFSNLRSTSRPSPSTRPKTTCLSSSHSVLVHVRKN